MELPRLTQSLKQGDRGVLVKLLQFGIRTKCDGIFGPNTASKLKDWQDSLAVPLTGEMTDEVWKTLLAQELESMKHLRLGNRFQFVQELDIDSDGDPDNRSPLIDVMTKYVWGWWNPEDKKEGAPWCSIFLSYILFVSYRYDFKSARVSEWKEHLSLAQNTRIITSKDQFRKDRVYVGGWLRDDGFGHIFFVDPVQSLTQDNNTIITLEGNTNSGGGREGDGVYERQRNLTDNLFLYSLSL